MMMMRYQMVLIARIVATIVLAIAGVSHVGPARAERPPNVLMIAVDDLACTLGCYGDAVAQTPHIDRLARRGVCFLNAYNQLPLCNPTRASLMTGRRPDAIGVYDLDHHFRDTVPDAVTLPQAFDAAGYFVARVGKIYHYNVPAAIGTDGHDDPASWQVRINPRGRDKDDEALVINAEPHRKISAALSWLAADGAAVEQTDGMIATEAIRLIRSHRDEPWFVAAGFFRPHTPYVAPKRFFDLYPKTKLRLPFAPENDRADIPAAAFAHNCPDPNYGLDRDTLLSATQAYYACVSFIDEAVGRLIEAVDQSGQGDHTIIVLWSDHGYHLGDHGGVWQKRTLFESSARSPMIIADPRRVARGGCRRIVEYVDLYPTLVDLADIEPTTPLDGQSLRPLLNDPIADWNDVAVTQVLRPADDRLSEPVMGRSVRTRRYRYTQWNGGEKGEELYDHHSDRGEFENLAFGKRRDANVAATIEAMRQLFRGKAISHPPTIPFNPARL